MVFSSLPLSWQAKQVKIQTFKDLARFIICRSQHIVGCLPQGPHPSARHSPLLGESLAPPCSTEGRQQQHLMLHVDTGRWSSPSCQGGPRLHGFVHLQQTTAIHDSTFARGTLRKWRDHEIFKDHQAPTLSDFPANINLCWTFTYLQKAGGLGLRKKSG